MALPNLTQTMRWSNACIYNKKKKSTTMKVCTYIINSTPSTYLYIESPLHMIEALSY